MITVTPITMSGVFTKLAEDFISFKRDQGYKYYAEAKMLRRFCRFTENYELDVPVLTREIVTDWTAPRDGEAGKSRLHRVSLIKQFGEYLRLAGHEACILPHSAIWIKSSFTPYIFTHDEIGRLFDASDRIRPVTQARDMHKSLPVLFRLLYSCGLRVSEAVGLRGRDVDLTKGVLTVRESKNRQERLIPISGSLLKLCNEYHDDVLYRYCDDDYFFPAPDRTILSPNTVYNRFHRVMWDAGIPYKGKGNGPRLHDLRHTFAVHTLQQWVKQGEDLTAMLPILSVFMGHKSMRSTSQYLRLTAEVYPDVVRQVEETCAYVIPGGEA